MRGVLISSYELLLRRIGERLSGHLSAIALSNLGRARLDVGTPGETDKGLQDLALACRREPDFADHFVLHVNALVEAGYAMEAVDSATEAMKHHPHDPSLKAALAFAFASAGNPAPAVNLYVESWEAEPFRPERLSNASECALLAGDNAMALKLAAKVLDDVTNIDLRVTAELIRVEARSHLDFAQNGAAMREWVLTQLRHLAAQYAKSEEIRANIADLENEDTQ